MGKRRRVETAICSNSPVEPWNRYRAVIEVAKFCSAETVLKTVEMVSKEWEKVAGSDELWREQCQSRQLPPVTTGIPLKTHFKLMCFPHNFAYQRNNSLHIFDIHTNSWRTEAFRPAIDIRFLRDIWTESSCFSLTCLRDESWLRTGGKSPVSSGSHSLANVFHTSNGRIHAVESLITPRCKHASILHKRHIYVFGGDQKHAKKTCESLPAGDIRRHWQSLPDMLFHHSQFNVCASAMGIYLIGGNYEYKAEVYRPKSRRFVQLSVDLPQYRGKIAAALSENNCLLIVGDGFVGFGTTGKLAFYENYWAKGCANMNAILKGDCIYQLDGETVTTTDIHTGNVHKYGSSLGVTH